MTRWCCFQLLGSSLEAQEHGKNFEDYVRAQERSGFGVARQLLPVSQHMSGHLRSTNHDILKGCDNAHA